MSVGQVDFYDSQEKNEDSISLLDDGITIMNKESAKGQEFDTVFILELKSVHTLQKRCNEAGDVYDVRPGKGLPVLGTWQGRPFG